jgi:hypothetical protein
MRISRNIEPFEEYWQYLWPYGKMVNMEINNLKSAGASLFHSLLPPQVL